MPDLKDLGFSVQEKVPVPDFDGLVRRGKQRRVRRQVLAMTGTAATAALVAVIAISPVNVSRTSNSNDPAHADPTVVDPVSADLRGFVMTAPDRSIATWMDCKPAQCRHIARLRLGNRDAGAASDIDEISVLRFADPASSKAAPEPIAVLGARLSPTLFRLTPGGPVTRKLRHVVGTSAIGPGEIVTDQVGTDGPVVVNVREATERRLRLPAWLTSARAPVRDETGRWWIVAGTATVAWTDDGGRNWGRHELTHGRLIKRLAVSPDGRTAVTIATDSTEATTSVSYDRGKTWRTVSVVPATTIGGPVVSDDGLAMMVFGPDHNRALWTVHRGTASIRHGIPSLDSLDRAGNVVYGTTYQDKVMTSADLGRTWTEITP